MNNQELTIYEDIKNTHLIQESCHEYNNELVYKIKFINSNAQQQIFNTPKINIFFLGHALKHKNDVTCLICSETANTVYFGMLSDFIKLNAEVIEQIEQQYFSDKTKREIEQTFQKADVLERILEYLEDQAPVMDIEVTNVVITFTLPVNAIIINSKTGLQHTINKTIKFVGYLYLDDYKVEVDIYNRLKSVTVKEYSIRIFSVYPLYNSYDFANQTRYDNEMKRIYGGITRFIEYPPINQNIK